jgi:putative tricarboxylic transport membrane protein
MTTGSDAVGQAAQERPAEEAGRAPDTDTTDEAAVAEHPKQPDFAQLWVCGFLGLLGALVIVDAARLGGFAASNDPIGPKPVPIILGILLFVVAAFYALDVVRGGHGEDEGANAGQHFDWKTIAALCGVFIANALLIDWLGWVISGSILFWGSAIVLGSRKYVLALAIAVVLALGTFYGFAIGLGLGLPAGVLQGIL